MHFPRKQLKNDGKNPENFISILKLIKIVKEERKSEKFKLTKKKHKSRPMGRSGWLGWGGDVILEYFTIWRNFTQLSLPVF